MLAAVLTTTSAWKPQQIGRNLLRILKDIPNQDQVDVGCVLEEGAFEHDKTLTVSAPEEALIFFVLRLVERLNALGPALPTKLMRYVRGLGSFQRWA